jgi:hypothetical protein
VIYEGLLVALEHGGLAWGATERGNKLSDDGEP